MKISVVIPTFNRADRIVRAVRSVLEQTLAPAEVIVVDDGSTDLTRRALSPFIGRIRYLLTPNGGVSRARNTGIGACRSDWIAFLDSDDVWHPEKLVHQSLCVSATGMRACFCGCTDDSGRPLDPHSQTSDIRVHEAGDGRLTRGESHPYIQSLLCHRSVFCDCGMFDESLSVAEDTLMFSRIAMTCGFVFHSELLVMIERTRHAAGLSDAPGPHPAFRRYDCYRRVQEEIICLAGHADTRTAATTRRRAAYFASRQAELACALGMKQQARSLARHSQSLGAHGRDRIRNGWIRHAWPLAKRHYQRKWPHITEAVSAPPPVTRAIAESR